MGRRIKGHWGLWLVCFGLILCGLTWNRLPACRLFQHGSLLAQEKSPDPPPATETKPCGVSQNCKLSLGVQGPNPEPVPVGDPSITTLTASQQTAPTCTGDCTAPGPTCSWSGPTVTYQATKMDAPVSYSPQGDELTCSASGNTDAVTAKFGTPGYYKISITVTGTWTGAKTDPTAATAPAATAPTRKPPPSPSPPSAWTPSTDRQPVW